MSVATVRNALLAECPACWNGSIARSGTTAARDTRRLKAALRSVFDRAELRVELDFQLGQIVLVNNRATGHARTEFTDHEAPERRRQLVRLWLCDHGGRGYRG